MPLSQPLSLPQLAGGPAPHLDAAAWFCEHFGSGLPRSLREQADGMSLDEFMTKYGASAGPLRLGHWACADAERPPGRLGPQARNFRAMIAVGDSISTSTAAASGPIGALTEMLHERGFAMEMVSFHQLRSGAGTATFVCGSAGIRTQWAMGCSDDPTQSALRALIACANRLFELA